MYYHATGFLSATNFEWASIVTSFTGGFMVTVTPKNNFVGQSLVTKMLLFLSSSLFSYQRLGYELLFFFMIQIAWESPVVLFLMVALFALLLGNFASLLTYLVLPANCWLGACGTFAGGKLMWLCSVFNWMKVNQHLFYFLSCKCLCLTALGVKRGRRMKLSSKDILYKT